MKPRYDICIVGLKCLDHLKRRESPRYLGGIEKQLTSLGRLLVGSGLAVCFVTYDDGGPPVEHIDGIDVLKAFDLDAGWPSVRFFYPRFFKLYSTIRSTKAATVVQMGAGVETGITAIAVKLSLKQSKFVFFTASDGDCLTDNPFFSTWREPALFRFGLKRADTVVVQSKRQAALIKTNFHQDAIVQNLPAIIDGAVDESVDARLQRLENEPCPRVLWVGRIIRQKRPEWVLQAAKSFPSIQFDLVGEANFPTPYAQDFRSAAAALPNVVMHGKLGNAELQKLFRATFLLLCTSELEGFPTTFLEAWAFAIPVVTSFDPDGMVRKNGLGFSFRTVDDLTLIIDECTNLSTQRELSEKTLDFFRENYSRQATMPSILTLLTGGGD